MQVLANYDLER